MNENHDKPGVHSPAKFEPCAKRIRAYLNGKVVADAASVLLVWEEVEFSPVYYFPVEDVNTDLLVEKSEASRTLKYGEGPTFDVKVGDKVAPGAAVRYDGSDTKELEGRIRLDFDAMDNWFEEDEEIFTHVRDPYHRVDILPSSRHIKVVIDGETVAESSNARILFETTLPARFYLPKTHVRMDLLVPSDTITHCPYKGQAQTWSVRIGDNEHKDVAWSYRTPLPESQKIAGHVAFLNEHVDHYVDGELQERPVSEFS